MKIILITGATSGIGLATAKNFLEDKENTVVSISRTKQNIDKAKLEFKNDKIHFFQADVSDIESVRKAFEEISKKFNHIDCLVNNAGNIISGGIDQLTAEQFDETLRQNLSSYYYVTQTFLPLLKKGTNSNIVNVSSISSLIGGSSVGYSVAKAGVNMLSQLLGKELAQFKIRVNTICPGLVYTKIHVHSNMMSETEYDKMIESQKPLYPFDIGEPIDIAEIICFLASDKSKWISGTNIICDGGRYVSM